MWILVLLELNLSVSTFIPAVFRHEIISILSPSLIPSFGISSPRVAHLLSHLNLTLFCAIVPCLAHHHASLSRAKPEVADKRSCRTYEYNP